MYMPSYPPPQGYPPPPTQPVGYGVQPPIINQPTGLGVQGQFGPTGVFFIYVSFFFYINFLI